MKRILADRRMVAVVALLVAGLLTGSGASADTWTVAEPWDAYPLDYYDGEPTGYGRPYEIWSMTISNTLDLGRFTFEIETNFGDEASRIAFGTTLFQDSYSFFKLSELVAGDLYIRRFVESTGVTTDVYGLVFEDRDPYATTADAWLGTLGDAGYSYEKKAAGELYRLEVADWSADPLSDQDLAEINTDGFATGSWEEYADGTEVPLMAAATGLSGLVDLAAPGGYDMKNAYPTILLGGAKVNDGSATWTTTGGWGSSDTTAVGEWSGSFTLPDYDPDTEKFEVWWAVGCGNDAVAILEAGSEPIPVPGSLLLCGIGLGFIGVVRRMRRKS